jgi:hypothetical protein
MAVNLVLKELERWWLFFDDEVRAAAQSNLPAASL